MEAGLFTLDEASGLTGLSIEALRKRVARRRIKAVKGNDGRIRVQLDDRTVSDLRRDSQGSPQGGRPPARPDGLSPDQSVTNSALSRAVEALDSAVLGLNARAEVAERRAERAEAEAADLRQALDQARTATQEAKAETAAQRALLRQAAEGLTAERAAKEAIEAEAARVREEAEKARTHAQTAEAEAAQLRKEAEQARAEAAEAVRTAETLRAAEKGRTTEAAAERALQVASRLDEAQFRRLQEADEARRALGLWGRLRAAWRGA